PAPTATSAGPTRAGSPGSGRTWPRRSRRPSEASRLSGPSGGLRAEVLLDLPIWGLDRPLTYRIPEALAGRVVPGMIVRAPLRGRRVRGWVLAVSPCPPTVDGAADEGEGLVDLAGVSGPAPVFDVGLLGTAYAMARR